MMNKPIGGYFELELEIRSNIHQNLLALNTGRNALEYILLRNEINFVYLPRFTCEVVLEPLKKNEINFSFYNINKNLEIEKLPELLQGQAIIYNNYFGLKDSLVKEYSKFFGNKLIVDNSQALFANPAESSPTFYSPRKFVGIPDGSYLYIPNQTDSEIILERSKSFNHFYHLLKRIDINPEAGYSDFKNNDQSLSNLPIQKMSNLTQKLLNNIDFARVQRKRIENYKFLSSFLKKYNKLDFNLDGCVPLTYPFYDQWGSLREFLIEKRIYCPVFWPNVFDWCDINTIEYNLASRLVHMPIDQRYGQKEMKKIIDLVFDFIQIRKD